MGHFSPRSLECPHLRLIPLFEHLSTRSEGSERRGVAIAYGSVWPTKQWGKERFCGVDTGLLSGDDEVFLVGSPEEREEGLWIANQSGLSRDNVVSGLLSLPDLVSVPR